jgi:DNA repair ATPase RecN
LLVENLTRLDSLGVNYQGCLSVASQFWVSAVLLYVLLYRLLSSPSRGVYFELERDIALKRLSAEEIKQRFTLEALGKPVADWLTELWSQLNSAHTKIDEILSRFSTDLGEVEIIDQSYAIERQGRARKLEEKYDSELRKILKQYDAISHQVKQFEEVSVSMKPSPELKMVLSGWKRDLDRMLSEFQKAKNSLEARLSAIYGIAAGSAQP